MAHLRRAIGGDEPGRSDGQLLADFIETGDEVAFEGLLRRHGPMVLGVCRRVLNNHHDAEDAFQAAFLVLVRRAGSIREHETVANWLYGVAYNTALKARARRARQQAREKQMAQLPEPEAPAREGCWSDLPPLLDQELSRLPDKYRAVLVLCDMEGVTRKEAAQQLGLREGTISSRLARARAMLARRLARRGVVVSAGTLGMVLLQRASACVPTSLRYSTVKAATFVAAGQGAAAGTIPATVTALTEGALKTMWLTKRTVATTLLLTVCAIGSAGLFTYHRLAAGEPEDKRAVKENKKAKAPATDKEKIQGTWEVVELVINGKKELPNEQGKGVIVIKGDKLSFLVREKGTDAEKSRKEFTIKLNPSKKPKEIDTDSLDGSHKGEKTGGIYELDGDKLKLCLPNDSDIKRPSIFESEAGSQLCLFTLKRLKR
jgi:RNA polymerase sigma factor (sigma-70 family)